MPSYKYPTRGYNGGWQGPSSALRVYSGGWVLPSNAFVSNGAGGWTRFWGDDIAFSHGNLELYGQGQDLYQGGEGGDPFYIHIYGATQYDLNPDGTVQYSGSGGPGSSPGASSGRWAEVGVDASKYDARYLGVGYYSNDWFNLAGPVGFGIGGEASQFIDYALLQIRHSASGVIVSQFYLKESTD